MTLLVPQVIILESFLSFLGLGVQEPMSSWGVLISQGANNIPGANWLLIFPSLLPDLDAVRPQLHRRRPARCARPEGSLTMPGRQADPCRFATSSVRFQHASTACVEAVKGVSSRSSAGETVAIVGEFGLGQEPADDGGDGAARPNGEATGSVRLSRRRTFSACRPASSTRIRGRKITMIFQEPMTSLDPLYTIGNQLVEPIGRHQRHIRRAGASARRSSC